MDNIKTIGLTRDVLRELVSQNLSDAKIGSLFGVSRQAIHQRRLAEKIERPRTEKAPKPPRSPKPDVWDRFIAKINKNGPVPEHRPELGPCWIWTADTCTRGYGRLSINNKSVYAHRYSWEQANGPIPDGLVIDHLCRNHSCVNPVHLEPVTPVENLVVRRVYKYRKPGYCKRDHRLDGDNLYISPSGLRRCRECSQLRSRHSKKQN